MNDPASLIQLCHHRWGAPILAEIQRSAGGMKFVAIQSRLGLSRDALSRTLGVLTELDLVLRNPGYGHPMRPEYLLTPFGEDAGPACLTLWDAVLANGQTDTAGRKWSLPALWAVHTGAERFTEISRSLYGVTPRALISALRVLEDNGLIERFVTTDRPPGVRYTVGRGGTELAALVVDLARALDTGR